MRSFYYHVVKGDLVVREHRPTRHKGYFACSVAQFWSDGFVYEVASNEGVPQIVRELIISLIYNCQCDRLNNLKHFMKYLREDWRDLYL